VAAHEMIYPERYEGMYSEQEVELNKRLYEECIKESPDFALIEELLKMGADPMGPTAASGWGLMEHIYGEMLIDLKEINSVHLPRLTELFLKYGMDVEKPRVPFDEDNSRPPMWDFAFLMNENTIYALEMLLDHGLSAAAAAEMWSHEVFDLINIGCGDLVNNESWNYECICFIKMLMLCASYEHVIENDEDLQGFIGCSYNDYDLRKFRKWDEFYCEFDTSHCPGRPEFYRSVVRIFEKASGKEVWKFGVCLNEGEF